MAGVFYAAEYATRKGCFFVMKRSGCFFQLLVVLTLAVAMMFAVGIMAFSEEGTIAQEKECYLRGDMNADGKFDNRDAIYVLYHSFFEEEYPLFHGEDADMNEDTRVDNKDAVELLYASLDSDSSYGKTAHDFYDPAWSWQDTQEGVSAQVTLKCACGAEHAADVSVTAGDHKEASCTEGGYVVYHAQVEGYDYTATYTKTLPASGHSLGEVLFDDSHHYQICSACTAEQNVASHEWVNDGEASVATCKVQAAQKYMCTGCLATKTEYLGYAEHTHQYVEDVKVGACTYAKRYVCVCGDEKLADEYTNHNYVTVITLEATCSQVGQKVTKCEDCGQVSETVDIPTNNSHTWGDGVEAKGIVTYTCNCGQQKTAVVTASDGSITKDALQSAEEVEVGKGTTMTLDETAKDSLPDSVQITVGTVSKDTLNLTDDQKQQIGDNTVYDFSMTSGGQNFVFDGEITITLPYSLGQDEDINAIEVWYIGDNGEPEMQFATYSNGCITFTTTHFSYYTVTRLTAAERCEKYGCIDQQIVVAPTCTEGGYSYTLCQRCGKMSEQYGQTEATGHSYKLFGEPTQPTCVDFGVTTYCCETCNHTKSDVTPALGHDMQETVTAATCTAPGKKVQTCGREGCSMEAREEVIPQLSHDYKLTTTVSATCTEGGYELHTCVLCKDEVKKNETAAMGHNHDQQHAEWIWTNSQEAPILNLSCANAGCDYVKQLTPKATVKDATCEAAGSASVSVVYYGVTYSKTIDGAAAKGHAWGEKWIPTEDGQGHKHQCSRCSKWEEEAGHSYDDGMTKEEASCLTAGLKVYTCTLCKSEMQVVLPAIGHHSYDDGAVTKQPGCTANGLKVFTCQVCGDAQNEILPATGHNFVDRVCTYCGITDGCDHEMAVVEIINLAERGMCEGELVLRSCPCGQETGYEFNFSCEIHWQGGDGQHNSFRCVNCSAAIEQTMLGEEQKSPCEFVETWDCSIFNGEGTLIHNYPQYFYRSMHQWDLTYTLLGESCEDGVHVTGSCSICGETTDYVTEDHEQQISEYDLAELGMCGGYLGIYSCLCGQESHSEFWLDCNLELVEAVDNCNIYQCANCGARIDVTYELQDEVQCWITYTYEARLIIGDYKLFFGGMWEVSSHNWITTQTLKDGANTCDDGYIVTRTCTKCNVTDTWENTGCRAQKIGEEVIISGDAYCGEIYMEHYSCACGRVTGQNISIMGCSFQEIEEGKGQYRYVCQTCGLNYTEVYVNREHETDPCKRLAGWEFSFYAADGTYLTTAAQLQTRERHNMVYTFELLGKTCDDGYYAKGHCVNCDAVENHEVQFGCSHWTVEKTEVLNVAEHCTKVYVVKESCACGKLQDQYFFYDGNCSWSWQYVENLDRYADVCTTCGLYYSEESTQTSVEGGPACQLYRYTTRTYYNGNHEVVAVGVMEGVTYNHTMTHTFEMQGKTCDDGYYLHGTCVYCGAQETYYTRGCGYHLMERIVVLEDDAYCTKVYKQVSGCPCGAMKRENIRMDGNCQWSNQYVEELGAWIDVCTVCGLGRMQSSQYTNIEGAPFCQRNRITTQFFYDKDYQMMNSVQSSSVSYSHQYVYTFTMNGKTCDEGYTANGTCLFCGTTTTRNRTGCNWYTYKMELLFADEGACGFKMYAQESGCPCGALHEANTTWIGNCCFDGQDAGGNQVCSTCGLYYNYTTSSAAVDGKPACYQYEVRTYSFYRNGELLGTADYKTETQKHELETSFQLDGKTCDDGYTVIQSCKYCDYREETYQTGCKTFVVRDELLFSDDTCGYKLYFREINCACGAKYQSFTRGAGNCQTERVYIEHLDRYVWKCVNCGLYTNNTYNDKAVEGLPGCKKLRTTTYYFYRDGVQLATADYQHMITQHSLLASFKLNGKTCEEGYTVISSCQYCDYSETSTGSGCRYYLLQDELLYADDGVCGFQMRYQVNGCACGALYDAYNYRGGNCQLEDAYVEHLDRYMDKCSVCGIYYDTSSVDVPIEGVTCQAKRISTYSFYRDGQLLKEVTTERTVESHNTVCKFTLLGKTCEDGYTCKWQCVDCGKVTSADETVYYEHNTNLVEEYDLADYETCGGSVRLYACACGQRGSLNRSMNCSTKYVEKYNEYGIQARYCAECDTYIYRGNRENVDYAGCTVERVYYFQLVRGDEVLLDLVQNSNEVQHTMLMVGKQTTENNNIMVYLQCAFCQQTETHKCEPNNHAHYRTQFIDLKAAGACGGYVEQNECVICDERSSNWYNMGCQMRWVSEDSKQINGVVHYYQTERCTVCGLTRVQEWYEEAVPEDCREYRYITYTYSIGDVQLGTVSDKDTYVSHDRADTTYVLKDGATSCEDGVIATSTCKYCGESESWEFFSHERILQESIDLTQYNSVCGSYLERYSCTCGRYQNCRFSEDYCDMGGMPTELWIEGAFFGSVMTVNGWWEYADSYARIYTCAVTDPQCAMQVRMAEYWLVENCIGVQYQTWQLGYNEKDGTWMHQVTIPTGETRGIHNFTETYEESALDDGGSKSVRMYLCNDCGTVITRENYDYADGTSKEILSSVNKVDDGNYRQQTTTREYITVENVKEQLQTLYLHEWIDANGNSGWSRQDFTYDLDNCTRTYVNTNSNGHTSTHTDVHFRGIGGGHWEKEPTCSQPGVWVEEYLCAFCGKQVDSWTEERNPNGHNWSWDEEKQIFVCTVCQMENINGADGSIVLEDLTAANGEAANYVVGYWNRGNVDFTLYVGVVLEDVTDGDNEIVLAGITPTYLTQADDGICAVAFDQAAVLEAAQAALTQAGYTGSWAIRVTFVQATAEGTLDYAITFDSQKA